MAKSKQKFSPYYGTRNKKGGSNVKAAQRNFPPKRQVVKNLPGTIAQNV